VNYSARELLRQSFTFDIIANLVCDRGIQPLLFSHFLTQGSCIGNWLDETQANTKKEAHIVKFIDSRGYTAYFLRRNASDFEDSRLDQAVNAIQVTSIGRRT